MPSLSQQKNEGLRKIVTAKCIAADSNLGQGDSKDAGDSLLKS